MSLYHAGPRIPVSPWSHPHLGGMFLGQNPGDILEVKLTGGIRELVSDVRFGVSSCESFFTIEIPTTKISTSQARNQ